MSIVGQAQERPDSPVIHAEINQRRYTRKLRVQSDDLADGPAIVGSAPGVPRLYQPYVFGNERDAYALCRAISCDRVSPGSVYWIVTCEYATPEPKERRKSSGQGKDSPTDNPLLQLPEVETSDATFQEVVFFVYDITTGKKTQCKASNGQVYDPPPTRDASRLVLTISRNESIFSPHPAVDVAYGDTCNSDIFWGSPAGIWKCKSIKSKTETKQLQDMSILQYLKCTYTFEAKAGGWDTYLLDAGTYYWTNGGINAFGAVDRKFVTSEGHPTTGPLNGDGGALNGDAMPLLLAGATPVFNQYRFYLRQPFGPLNLPQNFAQCA